jgi:hypothetical protein
MENEFATAMGIKISSDAPLSAWCLGFTKYSDFNRKIRKRVGLLLYKKIGMLVFTRQMPFFQLLDHIYGPRPNRKVLCPEIHLGAFGRTGHRFEDVLMLAKLVNHVAQTLCETNKACWAVTNSLNRGAKLVLQKAGFKMTDDVQLSDRKLFVYQYAAPKKH